MDTTSSLASYRQTYLHAQTDPTAYWKNVAKRLHWFEEPERVYQGDMHTARFEWFGGGKLNVAYNCVDRHAQKHPERIAIIWAGDEAGHYERISYGQLQEHVGRMANLLLAEGVKAGDRVCLYMPMIPEVAYAMLACARIGAVHSVVFAGFSAEALRDRIVDADAQVIITANEGLRGGKVIPLKHTVDVAIEGQPRVRRVLVAKRTQAAVPMKAGRDVWLHDALKAHGSDCPAVPMDSEAPLFILYTSGSTGKPKGVLHTTGGYLTYAAHTHELVFDHKPGDVYMCAADVGWVTGHSYILYGPLANGATTVMFESTPLYPDAGRYWRMVEDLGVTIFYTAPTALRAIARAGDDFVKRYNRKSLRVLGSVGEPINPEVWQWYYDVVGEGRCSVVDTWWQTETGGILISPLAGTTPPKPGSATLPLPGIEPVLVDDKGVELKGNGVSGNLCLRTPWPGQARTLYGDHARFVQTYFSSFPGLYFTGDGCRRDEDGYYWITGRVDDVLNVSGHRLGTAEIESALVAHKAVAEAAVVGFPHDIKGTGIYAFVHVTPAFHDHKPDALSKLLKDQVREAIGAIAVPDRIQIVTGLPKTRSGKIMRRILRKIAGSEYDGLGDLTTLADPDVVAKIVAGHKGG